MPPSTAIAVRESESPAIKFEAPLANGYSRTAAVVERGILRIVLGQYRDLPENRHTTSIQELRSLAEGLAGVEVAHVLGIIELSRFNRKADSRGLKLQGSAVNVPLSGVPASEKPLRLPTL